MRGAELVIRGTAADTGAVIDVAWDSGEGLNDYERRRFSFLPFRGSENRNVDIVDNQGTAAESTAPEGVVKLIELRIDDRGQNMPDVGADRCGSIPGHGWRLNTERQR